MWRIAMLQSSETGDVSGLPVISTNGGSISTFAVVNGQCFEIDIVSFQYQPRGHTFRSQRDIGLGELWHCSVQAR